MCCCSFVPGGSIVSFGCSSMCFVPGSSSFLDSVFFLSTSSSFSNSSSRGFSGAFHRLFLGLYPFFISSIPPYRACIQKMSYLVTISARKSCVIIIKLDC
jgi:hypothetical protein